MGTELAIPVQSEPVVLTVTDHTFSMNVDAIYCGGAGNLIAKLRGDAAARTWVVVAGQTLFGDWESVTKTNTTATNLIGLRSWRR